MESKTDSRLHSIGPEAVDISTLTAVSPRILWIELTSKCPFDCVFCTRKRLRGQGEHLDFDLYKALLRQLPSPEVIRLNYSGESIHYPRLFEAIELARSTGARTELVTVLGSLSAPMIEGLIRSGLERLSVSLHTLDPDEYRRIYRFGSLEQVLSTVEKLLETRRMLGSRTPMLDFAFVAMEQNLDQLAAVASYAHRFGINQISVHPVIQRDPTDADLSSELDRGQLRALFKEHLRQTVDQVRNTFPEVSIQLASRALDPASCLDEIVRPYPDPIPPGVWIHDCDQSPWETLHVLANGDLVPCEVHERVVLGNLREEPLRAIWQGEKYRLFREAFRRGNHSACRSCPWKKAFVPSPLRSRLSPADGLGPELLQGWYTEERSSTLWGKREALLMLARPQDSSKLHITGFLPHNPEQRLNVLQIYINGRLISEVRNSLDNIRQVDVTLDISQFTAAALIVLFRTRHTLQPARYGLNADVRELGFALQSAEVCRNQGGIKNLAPALQKNAKVLSGSCFAAAGRLSHKIRRGVLLPLQAGIQVIDACGPHLRRRLTGKTSTPLHLPFRPGISIIIPERENRLLLEACLDSCNTACDALEESTEVIVVLDGSRFGDYRDTANRFPRVRWVRRRRAGGYVAAIRSGLRAARHDWVYLLNNDMILEPDALEKLLPWRSPSVFALASQIFFLDPRKRREETGWTDYRGSIPGVTIFDREIEDAALVRGHLYAGGGSSLFRKHLLKKFAAASHAYRPCYWEDVEWGLLAWRMGFQVLFCPSSHVGHHHRATVGKFYSPDEIDRIFKRNSLLFHLRQGFEKPETPLAFREIARMGWRSTLDFLRPRRAAAILKARLQSWLLPQSRSSLRWLPQKFHAVPSQQLSEKPVVLLVSPFALFPPRHGGAVRIERLTRRLRKQLHMAILSDEAEAYDARSRRYFQEFASVHLLGGRPGIQTEPADMMARLPCHAHAALRQELENLIHVLKPQLILLEHFELAMLAAGGKLGIPWILTLHEVCLDAQGSASGKSEDTVRKLLRGYDALITCSTEDAGLLDPIPSQVIPNGLDPEGSLYVQSCGPPRILFVGPFRYQANLDGIRVFLEAVYPRLQRKIPDLELWIVGGLGASAMARGYLCFAQPGVRVIDWVEDIGTLMSQCSLTINPLLGIRGSSIKLLDSLAAGRACVSTRDGARGFSDAGLNSLVIVDSIEAFESPIEDLLLHPEDRIRIERLQRETLDHFSWEKSEERLSNLVHSFL